MQITDNQISIIHHFFKDKPVLKAYLFGSYVRGEATEESDIDILVDLDYSKRIGWDFIDMKLDLEVLLDKKVDLVSAKGISNYLKPYIDSDKKLIYER
jgi:uncharacterized protein